MDTIVTHINVAGESFVRFAAAMLIQSSLVVVILFGADRVIRSKVKAMFRYWLWMLVLVKLMLPTNLASPTSVAYWLGTALPGATAPDAVLPGSAGARMPIDDWANPERFAASESFASSGSDPTPSYGSFASAEHAAAPSTPSTPLRWQGMVLLAWLAGVIVMTLLLAERVFFVGRLVTGATDAMDETVDCFERCCKQLGMRRKVRLKLSPTVTSPSVCGVFRHTILIPEGLPHRLGVRQLRAVFLHELVHVKRGDLPVSMVQTILQILYIYNPLVWAANGIIRKIREQAVDEAVLAEMGEEAEDYPKTLLDVLSLSRGRTALGLGLVGVVESKKVLKERIRHMVSRPFPTQARVGVLGLMVVAVTAVVLLPMARAGNSNDRSSTTGLVAGAPGTKVLHFPKDRDVGWLEVESLPSEQSKSRRPGKDAGWDYIGNAQGDVVVPADRKIQLRARSLRTPDDLSWIAKLGPSDLHKLAVSRYDPMSAGPNDRLRLEAISHLTGLQSLGILWTDMTVRQFASLKSLSSLRELRLYNEPAIRGDATALLRNFPALEVLSLESVPVADADLEHIGQLSNLRELNLCTKQIHGPGLAHLAKLPHLEWLRLAGGGTVTYEYIRELQGLKGLKQLHLWNAGFDDAGLALIGKLTSLEEFTIAKYWTGTSPNFTDAGMAHLKNLKNLRRIQIVDLEIGEVGAGHLAALPRLESLESIALTGDGLRSFASCPSLKRLQFTGPVEVPDLVAIRSLEELEFHESQALSDEDLSRLASLSRLKNLRVGTADITEKGWASIAGLQSLEHLQLACGGETRAVTKSGLNRLNELVNLVDLDISASGGSAPVTEDALLNLTALKELKSIKLAGIPLQESELEFLADLDDLEALRLETPNRLSENVLRHVKDMHNLRDLRIQNITCTGAGLVNLSGTQKLFYLTLQGRVTDSALEHFPAIPSLFSCNVTTDVAIRPETIARLTQLLPSLNIPHLIPPVRHPGGQPLQGVIVGGPQQPQQPRGRPETRTNTRTRTRRKR